MALRYQGASTRGAPEVSRIHGILGFLWRMSGASMRRQAARLSAVSCLDAAESLRPLITASADAESCSGPLERTIQHIRQSSRCEYTKYGEIGKLDCLHEFGEIALFQSLLIRPRDFIDR